VRLYASACLKSGDNSAAYRAYRHLDLLVPGDPKILINLGQIAKALDRPDATEWTSKVVPAVKRRMAGKAGELHKRAIGLFEAGTPIEGLSRKHERLVRQADTMYDAQQNDDALELLLGLDARVPNNPDILYRIGRAHMQINRFSDAVMVLERAHSEAPHDTGIASSLVIAQAQAERLSDSLETLSKLSQEQLSTFEGRLANAILEAESGRSEEAVSLLESIEADHPGDRAVARRMVMELSALGRFDELENWVLKLSESAPHGGFAYLNASISGILKPDTELFRRAEAVVNDRTTAQRERAVIRFAIAKSLQAAGDHNQAFAHFEKANALVDRIYDPRETDDFCEKTKERFDRRLFDRPFDVERGRGRIFIVGMPRSGSTMVEQIMASHPLVHAVGESQGFYSCLRRLDTVDGYPDAFCDLDDSVFEELGQHYLDLVPTGANDEAFVVDKELLKFAHLGLLKLMLPGATVLHCCRDQIDICYSIFCQNFAGSHPYAYDLHNIAHFHRFHDSIMEHWNDVLPEYIHEAQYEQIIEDTEGEIRRLLEIVGLPFDAACLNYRSAQTTVRTASLHQVRQEIYRTSIGSWRRHEDKLKPLIEALNA
jgi:tetratricopeptide (TPR) repeat protein